jgi:hypothetical protein
MTQIILDASAISRLDALTQPVEVCDPAGRVVGKFVPNAADDFDPRAFYPLVDKTMADADAGDPTLESYQRYSQGAKP